jgi:seryl-tRNA synthetase
MLTIQRIKENTEEIKKLLKIKNFQQTALIDELIVLDDKRKTLQNKLDQILAESNQLAKHIGQLYKEGKGKEAETLKEKTAALKQQSKEISNEHEAIENEIRNNLYRIPNIPHSSVPAGKTEEDNIEEMREGDIPDLGEKALPHWELAKEYDLIDFDLGSKITGAGFPVYKGKMAKLQRALISFFLDEAEAANYIEVLPPLLINEASGIGTGQLPDKDGQMYHVGEDNLYLIPTAEVPITNIYRDVIVKEEDFPIKNVAYSPCFRREAGSYGKDVRGLNRLHQFDKVEIVQIQHPEKSYETLEEMKSHVASLLRKLKLPFRILRLCGGDLSFTAALTYDFEVYSAAQKKWLEVSSVSNFEDYQANRMKLRYKNSNGKTVLAHTLNGSALALPRIVAALLENMQTEDAILIPEVLQQYCGFDKIIKH